MVQHDAQEASVLVRMLRKLKRRLRRASASAPRPHGHSEGDSEGTARCDPQPPAKSQESVAGASASVYAASRADKPAVSPNTSSPPSGPRSPGHSRRLAQLFLGCASPQPEAPELQGPALQAGAASPPSSTSSSLSRACLSTPAPPRRPSTSSQPRPPTHRLSSSSHPTPAPTCSPDVSAARLGLAQSGLGRGESSGPVPDADAGSVLPEGLLQLFRSQQGKPAAAEETRRRLAHSRATFSMLESSLEWQARRQQDVVTSDMAVGSSPSHDASKSSPHPLASAAFKRQMSHHVLSPSPLEGSQPGLSPRRHRSMMPSIHHLQTMACLLHQRQRSGLGPAHSQSSASTSTTLSMHEAAGAARTVGSQGGAGGEGRPLVHDAGALDGRRTNLRVALKEEHSRCPAPTSWSPVPRSGDTVGHHQTSPTTMLKDALVKAPVRPGSQPGGPAPYQARGTASGSGGRRLARASATFSVLESSQEWQAQQASLAGWVRPSRASPLHHQASRLSCAAKSTEEEGWELAVALVPALARDGEAYRRI